MSDPERILKSAAADPAVRELLLSLREAAPGSNAGIQSWGAMAAKVAALPKVVPAPAAAPAGLAPGVPSHLSPALAQVVSAKLAAGVVMAAFLGVAGHWYRAEHRAPNRVVNPASSAPVAAPIAVQASRAAPPVTVAGVDTPLPAVSALARAAPSPAFSSSRLSRLDAEASLVATVRRELRGGDPRAALGKLRRLQAQFPNGELRQERDVLTVEALAASGNSAAAKSKAAAFVAAHPSSPLSARLERLVETR
jgi:hypothetical protein